MLNILYTILLVDIENKMNLKLVFLDSKSILTNCSIIVYLKKHKNPFQIETGFVLKQDNYFIIIFLSFKIKMIFLDNLNMF